MTPSDLVPGGASGPCAARYEALRGGALGLPIGLEHRRGLVVLLRRGMWAWAQAAMGKPEPTRVRHSPVACAGAKSHALINHLADLTLARPRRTP